uniref:Uncharacterized protein n=1 Tax=Arundo donax TaxID=35708 RepID=A0A0A9F5Z9_ARUDO
MMMRLISNDLFWNVHTQTQLYAALTLLHKISDKLSSCGMASNWDWEKNQ